MIDHNNISKDHYKGAASELKAMTYYLEKGMQVYNPVTQQGVVDFIVDTGSKLLKVQVKTATWIKSGNNKYLQCRTRLVNKYKDKLPKDLYDILFVVNGGTYWEIPARLIKSSNLSLENTGKGKVQWKEFRIH